MVGTMAVIKERVAAETAHLIHPLHHPSANQSLRIWVEGRGAIIKDADGREYIDGLAGLWNVNAGHGRRELADAAQRQMSTLAYHSAYAGSTN
jgi:adenosylmethionine-8-amino-7-oxononanoate aminotransferase